MKLIYIYIYIYILIFSSFLWKTCHDTLIPNLETFFYFVLFLIFFTLFGANLQRTKNVFGLSPTLNSEAQPTEAERQR